LFGLAFFISGQNRPDQDFLKEREAMVRDQIAARGVKGAAVLKAMLKVPRHLFVPESYRREAYGDYPLPIGGGQTISQPYIVAFMTESLALKPGDKVLEIGTGSGYQAAVLACLADHVYSIEIDPDLARKSAAVLKSAGFPNVRIKSGDGFFGWPEHAPFDAIIVTCAADRVPPRLLDQLGEGGRLILPLEKQPAYQVLTLFTRRKGRSEARELLDVRFVPMTGDVKK
jgi:protein-L-isoaspartate(D-aspartate) O-methyltransferase